MNDQSVKNEEDTLEPEEYKDSPFRCRLLEEKHRREKVVEKYYRRNDTENIRTHLHELQNLLGLKRNAFLCFNRKR